MAGQHKHKKLYNGTFWRKSRALHLAQHPLCVFCQTRGKTVPATVVDHKKPHNGDLILFKDPNNWQSLCKTCHNTAKLKEERGILDSPIGLDGWPVN